METGSVRHILNVEIEGQILTVEKCVPKLHWAHDVDLSFASIVQQKMQFMQVEDTTFPIDPSFPPALEKEPQTSFAGLILDAHSRHLVCIEKISWCMDPLVVFCCITAVGVLFILPRREFKMTLQAKIGIKMKEQERHDKLACSTHGSRSLIVLHSFEPDILLPKC